MQHARRLPPPRAARSGGKSAQLLTDNTQHAAFMLSLSQDCECRSNEESQRAHSEAF